MTQFLSDINVRRLPYLAEHKVQGTVVFPGAGYLELGLAAAQQAFGPGTHLIENVNFQQVLFLDEQPHPVQVVVSPEVAGCSAFQVFHLPIKASESADAAPEAWVLHAEGAIRRAQPNDPAPSPRDKSIEQLQFESSELLDRAECRRRLSCRGLDYGPAFEWSESTWRSDGEALSRFVVPETLAQGLAEYQLHPALLDACIQTIGATVPGDWAPPGSGQTYLPVAVRRVRVLGAPRGACWAHARARLPQAVEQRELIEGDLELYDDDGRVLADLQGVKLRRVGRRVDQDAEQTIGDWLYVPRWQLVGSVSSEADSAPVALYGAMHPEKPQEGLNGVAHCSQNGSANGHAHTNGTASVNGHPATPVPVWLLLVDSQGFGDRLAALLEKRGQPCVRVRPEDIADRTPAAYKSLLERTFSGDRPGCQGVIHLWSLDIPRLNGESGGPRLDTASLFDTVEHLGCESVLHLVQSVARVAWTVTPRCIIVTRGAQGVGHSETCEAVSGIGQSAVWGLGSVINVEHPELGCTLIDLDPGMPLEQDNAGLAALLADALGAEAGVPAPVNSEPDSGRAVRDGAAGDEASHKRQRQIAYRAGQRYVPRLARMARTLQQGPAEDAAASRLLNVPRHEPFRLEFSSPGSLNRLGLRSFRRPAPQRGEVEIEVGATGLNFSDVLKAMGLYPGLDGGVVPMGIECAGRIAAVGEEVTDLRVGDSVIAIAPFSFASHAVTQAWAVVPKPAHLTDEEAATIPIAFLTAHYALNRLAHVEPGERVLIHAAAGGVGLAAVQLCQARGCEIFATAGSSAKRDFLQSLGVTRVFDSRSLDFVEQIQALTSRQGVDVVLNSLPGEAIPASLSLLRAFGRFLEIGKIDIYQNRLLGMYPFQNNLSFTAIDLDRMLRERPQVVRSMFVELIEQFRDRKYQPLPRTVFPAGDVVGAFRYMQQRKNIGKVVVAMARNAAEVATGDETGPVANEGSLVRVNGSYLITGGLGALGLQTARWLACQGARHLLLAGRSAPGMAAEQVIAELAAIGVQVSLLQADVADLAQLQPALQSALESLPPLHGVVHAAGLLDDGVVMQLDRQRLARVLAPKLRGAWNLHVLTQACPLDFFILFSSVAPLLGSPGQANYAAGNAFLDALAHYRRQRGMPALSINWGPWAEIGMAARAANVGQLAGQGIMPMASEMAFKNLEHLLSGDVPQAGVMDVDWSRLGPHYPAGAPGLLADLIGQPAAAKSDQRLKAEILATCPAQRPPARTLSARAIGPGYGTRCRQNRSAAAPEQSGDRLADGH